ncbi:hypothetical protein SUDANB176_00332 [Streptomyces sp. enrichment culture]
MDGKSESPYRLGRSHSPMHSATRHRWTADTRLRRSSEAEGWFASAQAFAPDQATAVRAPERQEEE